MKLIDQQNSVAKTLEPAIYSCQSIDKTNEFLLCKTSKCVVMKKGNMNYMAFLDETDPMGRCNKLVERIINLFGENVEYNSHNYMVTLDESQKKLIFSESNFNYILK